MTGTRVSQLVDCHVLPRAGGTHMTLMAQGDDGQAEERWVVQPRRFRSVAWNGTASSFETSSRRLTNRLPSCQSGDDARPSSNHGNLWSDAVRTW